MFNIPYYTKISYHHKSFTMNISGKSTDISYLESRILSNTIEAYRCKPFHDDFYKKYTFDDEYIPIESHQSQLYALFPNKVIIINSIIYQVAPPGIIFHTRPHKSIRYVTNPIGFIKNGYFKIFGKSHILIPKSDYNVIFNFDEYIPYPCTIDHIDHSLWIPQLEIAIPCYRKT